jgi:hypothetical protein
VGFEATIAVLERAKTVRALDRSATAIGRFYTEEIMENRSHHSRTHFNRLELSFVTFNNQNIIFGYTA